MPKPPGWPEDVPFEQMSQERFEQLLQGVVNAASASLTAGGEAIAEDQRAVWNAAEIALAILIPHREPRRQALQDARVILSQYWDDMD